MALAYQLDLILQKTSLRLVIGLVNQLEGKIDGSG
jgi:hypothetical protein